MSAKDGIDKTKLAMFYLCQAGEKGMTLSRLQRKLDFPNTDAIEQFCFEMVAAGRLEYTITTDRNQWPRFYYVG